MWNLILAALRRLPQGALSRAFGWVADRRIPGPLRKPVLGGFARVTGIRMDEAERDVTEYSSVNRLFVRRLRPGVRDWPAEADVLASPVDGVVGQAGRIHQGILLQAKGLEYTVAELLGGDHGPEDPGEGAWAAETFTQGTFVTLYLSPRHYHRIHTPLPGAVVRATHIPGSLLPVNRPAVERIDRLFALNERLTAFLETALGPVAVVAVGAYNVGRISTAFDPAWSGRPRSWITNRRDPLPRERRYDPPVAVARGDEIMAFHLGSTVILLTREPLALEERVRPGEEVRAGQVLARRPA